MADNMFMQPVQLFFLGHYDACIDQLSRIHPTDKHTIYEKEYLLASCNALRQVKSNDLVSEFTKSQNSSIKALGWLLATKNAVEHANDSAATQSAESALTASKDRASTSFGTFSAAIAAHLTGDIQNAIKLSEQITTIEMRVLKTQLYLTIHREDLAQKEAKELLLEDDETAIVKFSQALISHVTGNPSEAMYTLTDIQAILPHHIGKSVIIENAFAVAEMQQNKWMDAYRRLTDLSANHGPDDITLQNMICCARHLGKNSEVDELNKKLLALYPNSEYAKAMKKLNDAFDNSMNYQDSIDCIM